MVHGVPPDEKGKARGFIRIRRGPSTYNLKAHPIRDGRVITTLLGVPFDVAIYKLGDKYIAARSNEFNYANYEIESVK
jgi:hypothetical protein